MILALVSSGRSLSDASAPKRSCWCRDRQPASTCSTVAEPPSAAAFSNAVVADGDHLLGVLRLHRGDGVAGVDRTRERVLALDREDVGDLHHVEQGRDARRDIFAGRRGRREEGVVAVHQLGGDRRDRLRQAGARAPGSSATWTLATPAIFAAASRDAHRHCCPATSACTSPSLEAAVTVASVASLIGAAVMFDQDQNAHFATPKRLELCRPARRREPTLIPACRLAGSATFSVSSRGATSTP